MLKSKRIFISSLLIICIVFTSYIIYQAIQKDEWNTLTSALSVITAVLAIWSSLNITWKQEDDQRPNIALYLDTKTFKHATNLIIENTGGGPAYNIKIEWVKPLLDSEGSIARFTDFEDDFDIYLLPSGKSYSRFVHATAKLFENNKSANEPLIFEGVVSYSMKKSNHRRIKETFKVTLEPHRKSLQSLNDQMNFYAENKEIAKAVKELNNTLKLVLTTWQNNGSTNND